jgi:hypothetical protein
MNEDNILDERTRGAAKPKGTYTEPGDDEVSFILQSIVCIPCTDDYDRVSLALMTVPLLLPSKRF